MSNLFGDPSLELQLEAGVFPPVPAVFPHPGPNLQRWYTDGLLSPPGDTINSTQFFNEGAESYEGVWVIQTDLKAVDEPGGPGAEEIFRFGQSFDLQAMLGGDLATPRNLRCWMRTLPGGTGQQWQVKFEMHNAYIDPSTILVGTQSDFTTTVELNTLTEEWQQVTIKEGYIPQYEIVNSPYDGLDWAYRKTLGIRSNPDAGNRIINRSYQFDSFTWLTDDEEAQMAKRRDMLDACKTTLEGITTANGHTVEVKRVNIGYLTPQNVDSWPTIALVYGDEIKNTREMHRKQATLMLHALVYCEGSATNSPDVECDEIAKSIEVILETKVANTWLSLGYIEDLSIVKIDPYEVPEEVSRGRRVWVIDIQITYHYDRLDP